MSVNTNSPEQVSFEIEKELSIVELEERFELTAAALDTDRCSGNSGQLQAQQ